MLTVLVCSTLFVFSVLLDLLGSRIYLSFGAGVDVGGNIEYKGFSGAMLVNPDPTLSVSSSESPP